MVAKRVIKKALPRLEVNATILWQRVKLESDLLDALLNLPTFLIAFFSFMIALTILAPTERVSEVHRHIKSHFGISAAELSEFTTFDQIYDYVEEFERKNEEIQPTSTLFWCEKRYTEHVWDDHLLVPVYNCQSPRFFALEHNPDEAFRWSTLNAEDSASSSSASSSTGHRRLSEKTRRRLSETASSSASSSTAASSEVPHGAAVCPDAPAWFDNDEELQREEGDDNLTCASFKDHVCDIDLGVSLCPVTCGYCPPFEYEPIRKFDKPQVTLLPIVVHQTRFESAECHGFAHSIEMQPHNQDLIIWPALDGKRNGRILTCIDRTKRFDGAYAHSVRCPEGSNIVFCDENGYYHDSPKHIYHDEPVYAKFLTEAHKQVDAMRRIGWLDVQTATSTVSTLVYTEKEEVFTSVSITFQQNFAGNIDATYSLVSYHDLSGSQVTLFVILLVFVILLSGFDIFRQSFYLLKHREQCSWGFLIYELICRIAMCGYSLILLISWSQQTPMADEYDQLLHTILDFHGHGHAEFEEAIQTYFDVKTHIWGESMWLFRMKISAYIILYMQFALLILYMGAHPRLASLLAVLQRAMGHIMHWMILFTVVFTLLGFASFWLLGDYVTELGHFTVALASQAEILYGAFVFEETQEEVSGIAYVLYWLYAIVFMLTVTFILMGMFGGILLNAVFEQAQHTEEMKAQNGVLYDCVDTISSRIKNIKTRFPHRKPLLDALDKILNPQEDAEKVREQDAEDDQVRELADQFVESKQAGAKEKADEDVMIAPTKLMEMFPQELGTEDRLAEFLCLYHDKCEDIIGVPGGEAPPAKAELGAPTHSPVTLQQALHEGFSKDCSLNSAALRMAALPPPTRRWL